MSRSSGVLVAVAVLVSWTAIADAKPEPAPADADTTPTAEEVEASLPPHLNGPTLANLGHSIEVDLPAGMFLLERKEAQAMLEEGGSAGDDVLAIVGKVDAGWMVVIEYADVGYVTDTDADKLDANDLFAQYQAGTKQQNERRKTLGVPELVLDGWSEMPGYRKQHHQLVWGLKGHTTEGPVINYFTRLLGRNGYLSVNLIDAADRIEQSKIDAAAVLTGVRYQTGFRYEDHVEGDKSSGIGLRALVLGGTGLAVMKAAKAGLIIKLLLVFKKGFLVIGLAIAGFFRWLFGRKNKDAVVADTDLPPSDPTPPTDSQA